MEQNYTRKELDVSILFEVNITNKHKIEERKVAKILLNLWAVFGGNTTDKQERLGF